MNNNKKIAIFGGSFNPIHNAHIELCTTAIKEVKLDEIYIMPTIRPVHKDLAFNVSFEDRFNMVKLATKSYKKLIPSDFEKNINYTPYSINIVKDFKEKYNIDNLFFIIGFDSLYNIETWGEYEKLFKEVTFIVANRNINIKSKFNEFILYLEEKYIIKIIPINYNGENISSSNIRNDIENNKQYLDVKVYNYIKKNNLYE